MTKRFLVDAACTLTAKHRKNSVIPKWKEDSFDGVELSEFQVIEVKQRGKRKKP